MAQANKFKKIRKSETIVRDIAAEIQTGKLLPEDKISTISSLRSTYSVSQHVVEEALRILTTRGVLYYKRNCGHFVNRQARLNADEPHLDISREESILPEPDGGQVFVLEHFNRPLSQNCREEVNLYVTDIYPRCLQYWNENLVKAPRSPDRKALRIFNCSNGHLMDIAQKMNVDAVLATPAVLGEMGADRLLPVKPQAFGLEEEHYLDLAREYFGFASGIEALPFSLTLYFFFVNLELAEAIGWQAEEFTSIETLLDFAIAAEPDLRKNGTGSLHACGNVMEFLLMNGAIDRDEDGKPLLDEDRASLILNRFHRAPFDFTDNHRRTLNFLEGKSLFLHHCSYFRMLMEERSNFAWKALAVPVAEGFQVPADILLLAARKGTRVLPEVLQYMKDISSPEFQSGYGKLHGNIPVTRSACADLASGPMPREVIARQMARSSLYWPMHHRCDLRNGTSLVHVEQALLKGEIGVREALSRLAIHISHCAAMDTPLQ
ncbi:MAG: GntR family transcriptional regulator [Planctomycetes bacterium]|nr:GntR family transcriptional regulator [Planctomycetota bacterium]